MRLRAARRICGDGGRWVVWFVGFGMGMEGLSGGRAYDDEIVIEYADEDYFLMVEYG